MGQAAGPLSISLFGHVSIADATGASPVTLPKSALALLAYLIVFRDESLRRDRLAFALWPDEPEIAARANLRRHLHLLGRALSSAAVPCLIVDARTVRWNGATDASVDLIAFENELDAPATRAIALGRYRGDLALDADAEWLDAPRARLRERFFAAAHDEARAALVAADVKRACSLAEQILAIDPWREDAVRIVLEARASTGDRSGALAYYQDFRSRLRAEMDAAPMEQTREIVERLTQIAQAPRLVIAAPLSRLIGRSQEIATIERMLEEARLVTVTGPGGVGKTRLAAEIGARYARSGDAIAAYLASASDDRRSVESIVLEAFGIAAGDENAVDVIARIVGSRPLLLALDNADRVTVATADFAGDLLRRTAKLRILVTSQRRLRLDGERVFALWPLAVPNVDADLAEIERSEAVQLFFDRARASDAAFDLSPDVAASIASICRHVDGLPLSVELAAARANVLTIPEIEERLSDRFDFLRSSRFGDREQHRTLRATLDWSFDSLSESERAAFCAFAVFANGWTLAAATALVGNALDDLTDLIERSLVVTHTAGSSRRYGFLESIRLYARERLNSAGDRTALERRAFDYYTRFVAERVPRYASRDERAAFDEIAADHENIVALLDAAIERGETVEASALAVDLAPYWIVRGFAGQGRRRLDSLLEREDALPPARRVDLKNAAVRLHLLHGDVSHASTLVAQSLRTAIEAGCETGEADALLERAKCAFAARSAGDAEPELDRALAIYARVKKRAGEARIYDLLGQYAEARGAAARASTFYRRSLAIHESLGNLMGIAIVNYHLGFSAAIAGDFDTAAAFCTKAMRAWSDYGFGQGENWARYSLACAETALGRGENGYRLHVDCVRSAHRFGYRRELINGFDRMAEFLVDSDPDLATRCLAYAAAGRERSGYAVVHAERQSVETCTRRLRERLDAETFASQWSSGREADEGELIASLPQSITGSL